MLWFPCSLRVQEIWNEHIHFDLFKSSCVSVCVPLQTHGTVQQWSTQVYTSKKHCIEKQNNRFVEFFFFFFSFLFLMGSDEFCELKRDDKLKK